MEGLSSGFRVEPYTAVARPPCMFTAIQAATAQITS
jgi:hypothetical protein